MHHAIGCQGPRPLRELLCSFKQENTGFASTQASLENVRYEPGSVFTSRQRCSNQRNYLDGRQQQP
jgi:hypothetical protein